MYLLKCVKIKCEKVEPMPFRKAKGKKYDGIYEYFSASDKDKVTRAHYISYRGDDGKSTGRVKIDALTLQDALSILNSRKEASAKVRRDNSNSDDILKQRVKNNALTFNEMAALFYSSRTAKNNTKDKQRYENHLSSIIGRRKVSKFTTNDALELQAKLLKTKIKQSKDDKSRRTISPKTVDNIIDQLKSMFNEGMRDKNRWCSYNPVADKDVKKLTADDDKTRLRILTDDELQKLFDLAVVKPQLYLLMKLLYHTAARPDTIISLQVKDTKFPQKRIHLKALKKAKAYSVPMTEDTAKLIQDWIDEHELKPSHYLFYPLQTYKKATTAKAKDAVKHTHAIYENFRYSARSIMDLEFNDGIPAYDVKNRVSLYTLRHTAATKLVKKMGIKVAKDYLNHSDLKVTEIYAKIVDEQMEEAAGAL